MTIMARRAFLARSLGGLILLGGGSALLTSCSGGGATASGKEGSVTFRLSYTHSVSFAGTYLAITEGFYAAQGIEMVELLEGGPTATPAPLDVGVGKALLGVASTPDQVATARINGGAAVKIIGALYQKNPYAVTSLSSAPIRTPQDLVGRTIGVQAVNETVWAAFLSGAGIDPASVTTVPVQFDPSPLTQGEVDGWFSFVTNEPVTLAAAGYDVETLLLADNGYPLVAQVYVADESSLSGERRADLVACLTAEVEGWIAAVTDPRQAAEITIEKYAPDLGLDLTVQTEIGRIQNGLIVTNDIRRAGLMTVTDDLVAQNLATLAASGLELTADELFDLSVLAEVYDTRPDLATALADPAPEG